MNLNPNINLRELFNFLKKDNLINILILFTFSASFFLRIYQLESYPLPINQDELSNIYDGYSIAETGADRWGNKYPLLLRAFGNSDYRPPLYAYISSVSVSIFGYSVFSGRLPSAILGCLSLILIFIISKKLGGRLAGFLTLLLAGLSPWHLLFSRMAHEGTALPSFFIVLVIFLWLKLREENYSIKYLILLGFSIGIATNAYQSTKLIFFLLAIFSSFEVLRNTYPKIKKIIFFLSSILLGALPQIIAAISLSEYFFSRANGTLVEFSFSFEYFKTIILNYCSNLSPHYLFFSFGEYNNLSIGRLLTIEAIFFYLGIIVFLRIYNKSILFNPALLYLLLVIVILPSALTFTNPHALRASCCSILLPLFSSAGIIFIYRNIKHFFFQKIFISISISLIILNSIFLINKYIHNFELRDAGQQNILVQISKVLNKYQIKYSKIYMEDMDFDDQPYIYITSYCNIHPKAFQLATKKIEGTDFYHFLQFDKYYFLSRDEIDKVTSDPSEKKLFILQSLCSDAKLLSSINFSGQQIYFYEK